MRSRNQLVLPLNLEIKIEKNDPVRKLAEICDELDYTKLYSLYLRSWRKIDPAVLFEILVFAYMNGIYSSRDIEKAYKNERLAGVIEELFCQLVEKLCDLGEISYKNIFIDGTNRRYKNRSQCQQIYLCLGEGGRKESTKIKK